MRKNGLLINLLSVDMIQNIPYLNFLLAVMGVKLLKKKKKRLAIFKQGLLSQVCQDKGWAGAYTVHDTLPQNDPCI